MVLPVLDTMPPTVATWTTLSDWYLILGTVAGVIVGGYMVYMIAKNRERPGRVAPKYHAEGDWGHWKTVVLTLCVTGSVLALVEYESFAAVSMVTIPNDPNALQIGVTGRQFSWSFTYPNGHQTFGNLIVPAGQTVILNLTSADVTHSFYIPALEVAKDVQPGIYNQLWFNQPNVGVYTIQCRQLCGVGHAFMKGNLTVLSPSDYAKWYSALPAPGGK